MELTVRMLGLEVLHVEVCTDPADGADGGYDRDVVSTAVDGEPDGDVALGFVPPGVVSE